MSLVAATARCLRLAARPAVSAQQSRTFTDSVGFKRWVFK